MFFSFEVILLLSLFMYLNLGRFWWFWLISVLVAMVDFRLVSEISCHSHFLLSRQTELSESINQPQHTQLLQYKSIINDQLYELYKPKFFILSLFHHYDHLFPFVFFRFFFSLNFIFFFSYLSLVNYFFLFLQQQQ